MMEPAIKSPRVKSIVAAVLVAAATGTVWWRLWRPPSLMDAVNHTIQAVQNGDGDAAMRFIDIREVNALGLTGAKLDKVLKELNKPLSQASTKHPPLQTELMPSVGVLRGSQSTILSNGNRMEIEVLVANTDDGPKLLSFVHSLMLYGASAKMPNDDNARMGLPKLEILLSEIGRLSSLFSDAGIGGVYLTGPIVPKYVTWDESKMELVAKIQRARKLEAERNANR